ncbi:MAG: nickel-dependent lactate racemase [Ruminococcaceae bacterium]|nr:nickel-dependent lactate racemase [Oscillospiraceae bacterium]
MKTITFPYGKATLAAELPEERLAGILLSNLHHYVPEKSEAELVEEALANPIGSAPLCELVRGKENVVIIASDHTRPVPSKLLMPPMLREIRRGNPNARITILIATGCHRGTTEAELRAKFGDEIFESERIVIHDCDDTASLVSLGTLPSGGELIINRIAAEADFLCSEGFIEPHFFAGFSGGRKSVLPGVASRRTVMYNHCAPFIASDHARTGILDGNPIHRDMIWAAKRAKLGFVLNVVLGAEKQVLHAVAGDCEAAHLAGCAFINRFCRVKAIPADIAISTNGGYPLDQNIYQSVKGMTAAEATVKEGGVIIMISASDDGHGGERFYNTFRDEPDTGRLLSKIEATPPADTIPDQWESQILARIQKKAHVLYLSEAPDEMIRNFHMTPVHSMEEALAEADRLLGRSDGTITAIPDGISVVVVE